MDQNLSSVKTFAQLMLTDIKNKGFTRRFKRSLEFLQNHVQELKSEVAQIKNMDKNNYSQSAFDGAVERIRIFEDSSRRKNIKKNVDNKKYRKIF